MKESLGIKEQDEQQSQREKTAWVFLQADPSWGPLLTL